MIRTTSARLPVLLAHSYYLRYDEKQTRKMKPYPPLGTLLAAAVLGISALLVSSTAAFEVWRTTMNSAGTTSGP